MFAVQADQKVQHDLFGSHVNTPGGLRHEKDSGLQREGLGNADFLLVPPREAPDNLLRPRATDVQLLDEALGVAAHGPTVHYAKLKTPGPHFTQELFLTLHGGGRHVHLDGFFQEQPHAPTVFGDKGQTAAKGLQGMTQGQGSPFDGHDPPRGIHAHDAVGHPDLAVPRQTPEPQDLPLEHLQRKVFYHLSGHIHFQVLQPEQDLIRAGRGGAPIAPHRFELSSHHELRQVPHRRLSGREIGHLLSIPEHRDAVGDLDHLVQAVRDEDEGYPLGGKGSHGIEQHLSLGLREHRRGLVQHQEPGLFLVQLSGDLHKLHVPHGKPRHGEHLVDGHAHTVQRRPRVGSHGGHVQVLQLRSA